MRSAYFTGTAANTDVLAGGVLDNLGPGIYAVYPVSTVLTATLTCTSKGVVKVNGAVIPVHADATEVQPDVSRDQPYRFKHNGDGRPTIAVGGTTGTWVLLVIAEGARLV